MEERHKARCAGRGLGPPCPLQAATVLYCPSTSTCSPTQKLITCLRLRILMEVICRHFSPLTPTTGQWAGLKAPTLWSRAFLLTSPTLRLSKLPHQHKLSGIPEGPLLNNKRHSHHSTGCQELSPNTFFIRAWLSIVLLPGEENGAESD